MRPLPWPSPPVVVLLTGGLLLAVGCSASITTDAAVPDLGADATVEPADATALFVLPRPTVEPFFYDLPWPTELRRAPSGRVDVTGFPNPLSQPIVTGFVTAINARLDGWGTNAAVYFRFDASIDPSSLPATPEASLAADASVFLLDVESGQRHPVVWHYQDEATQYWAEHTLAVRPVYGLPLAGGRPYVAVVTDRVRTAAGGLLRADEDLAALLSGASSDVVVTEARALHQPALDALAGAGVPPAEVRSLAYFVTQDPTADMLRLREWLLASYPAPSADVGAWTLRASAPSYQEVNGRYGPSPIVQAGALPYLATGGEIVLDASGAPTVHGEFDPRFSLVLPQTPMPDDGYPVVIYAHGTDGDYRSVVRTGLAVDLAEAGIATMGVDQIHHGERNAGGDPGLLFFNVLNPDAARDNVRQSALDVVQQARLLADLAVPLGIADRDGRPVVFDANEVYFIGHSQGGLNGPLFLAIDGAARGAVLSASTGVIAPALREKTMPDDPSIPELVVSFLQLSGDSVEEAFETEGFVVEHPIPNLLQTWIEAADAVNYASRLGRDRPAALGPLSVVMTEGLLDAWSPPLSIEALAGAIGLPVVRPVESVIDALRLRGIDPVTAPVTGNLGGATGGLLQYPDDGHFLIFQNPAARTRVIDFLDSLTEEAPGQEAGTIGAP
ncbi:MAG: hypothetical protein ACFCGT_19150 [Sandaracinaceae bacterium]